MASISTTGASIDVKGIVDALVNADISPLSTKLDKQQASFTTQLSALGQVKSSLAKLQTSMNTLSNLKNFYTLNASVSDPSALIASQDEGASPGNYQLDIQQLASRQSLASSPFATSSTVVGNGSITIDFGTYNADLTTFTANASKSPVTINIAPGQNTLSAIKDAINNSNSGVQASIVQDGSGARLTISGSNTGKDFAMKISVADADGTNTNGSGLSALAYDPTTAVNSMTQTIEALDSKVKINGLLLQQSTNQLKEAIAGMTLDLKKAQPGTTIFLNIDNNKTQLSNLVNDFVKQYNDTMTTLNSLSGYNPDTKTGGILQSDASIRNLKANLSKVLSQTVNDSGSLRSLADIGIKSNSKGLLEINATKLSSAIDNNYSDVGSLFAKTATATDSDVKINSVGADVKAGTYNLAVNSFVPGTTLTGTFSGIYASSTNGLTLTGTGAFASLSVDILAGSIGARGTITIKDGVAGQLNNLLNNFLSSTGSLAEKTNNINDKLTDITDKRTLLQTKALDLQKRYTAQYSALDALLTRMQSTSDFLTQQLASISKITSG